MAKSSDEICVVPQVILIDEEDGVTEACSDEDLAATSSNNSEYQRIFYEKLIEYDNQHQGSQRKAWTQERIIEVINEINTAKETRNAGLRRTPMGYYWMSKYDVMKTSSEYYLIFKKKTLSESTVRIVPREIYFEILSEIHTSCGHGGRDKMLIDIKNKYYIPKKAVEIYVSLCPICETKKKFPKKGTPARLNESQDFNTRGHFELIDLQKCPDGDYNWLLHYQDDATKFVNLRPLKSNQPVEVAVELIKIFLSFGAPSKLLSNNVEFTAKVVEQLITMCPDCKTVTESQYKAQGSNEDIKNSLKSWMKDNNSTNWSTGVYFLQYDKNVSCHSVIGRSPYKALFGCDPKTGLTESDAPISVTDDEEILDPLREAGPSPVSGKCSCKLATHQCRNNRCACYKRKAPCGAKCHGSFTCVNKLINSDLGLC